MRHKAHSEKKGKRQAHPPRLPVSRSKHGAMGPPCFGQRVWVIFSTSTRMSMFFPDMGKLKNNCGQHEATLKTIVSKDRHRCQFVFPTWAS